MYELQAMLARQCFTQFALEQQVPLEVLREAAEDLALPLASSAAPDWFTAAAQPEAALLDLAPELQILPADSSASVEELSAQVADIDLVRMYAPELAAARDAARAEPAKNEPEDTVEPESGEHRPAANGEDSSAAIRLLRELSGIEE